MASAEALEIMSVLSARRVPGCVNFHWHGIYDELTDTIFGLVRQRNFVV